LVSGLAGAKVFPGRKYFCQTTDNAKTGARACGGYQAAAAGRGLFYIGVPTSSYIL